MISGDKIKSGAGILLIVGVFIAASYIAQNHLDFLQNYIKDDFFSMIIYILILVVSAVVAPVDVVFLMPIAVAAWGWIPAALLSLLGWTLGSALVFVLCRKYGVPLIKKLLSVDKIYKYEKFMPKKQVFLEIVFLRFAIPIDVISYAIGLFTRVRFIPYFFATLIGFLPLAFFLAYVGTLPAYMQTIGFIVFLLIVVIGFLSIRYRNKKK